MNNKTSDEPIYFRCDSELKQMIDAYRKSFDEIPTRSDAIRQLLKLALEKEGFSAPK